MQQAAGIVAEQPAGRAQQQARIARAHLLGAVTQDQPGEFFGIGQGRFGNQFDDRALGRAADLDAGFNGQAFAQGAHVERRIVGQALEVQDAAFQFEGLAVGFKAPVARAYRAARAGQVAAARLQAQVAIEAGAEPRAAEQEARPEIDAEVEIKAGAQAARCRLGAAPNDHIVREARGPARRQGPIAGIGGHLALDAEGAILPVEAAFAGEQQPLFGQLPGTDAFEAPIQPAALGPTVDLQFAL